MPSSASGDTQTYILDAVEINSVGDVSSESGISEGFLRKNVASGPLDNKKVIDMPFQVNTITRELLDNQSVQSLDEAVKYIPSAEVHNGSGPDMGYPKTRGFGAYLGAGTVFWDGFYSMGATNMPMAMFDSFQAQNGLAGALYGTAMPTGIFNYSRKRPLKDYNAIWFDFISRGNLGVGLDTSDRFQYVGYRAVLFTTNGEREPANNESQKQLASFALDFYPLDNLIFETNFSNYRYIMSGYYDANRINITNGTATSEIPSIDSVGTATSERFAETTTASAKFKYAPVSALYVEGGYQWQRSLRARNRYAGTPGFDTQSGFLKAQSEFDTGFIHHNIAFSANGIHWKNNRFNKLWLGMQTTGLLYDISIGEHFEVIVTGAHSWLQYNSTNSYEAKSHSSGFSYAGSLIYKAIPEHLNMYLTYSDSLQAGAAHTYGLATNGNITCSTNPAEPTYHPKCGQTEVANPYRSQMYEFGVKARVAEIDLSAAVFQITRPTYYAADDGSGYTLFAEQGEQRNRGFELTTGGKIFEPLSVYGGVTLLDARMNKSVYKDAEGKKKPGEPLVQANVLFDFAVPYTDKLAFTTNFHYTDKRWVDEMNTKAVDGYFTMDLGVRYATRKWFGKETTLRLNVNNLFNEKYWASLYPNSYDGNTNGSTYTNLWRSYDRTIILSGQIKF